MESLSLGVSRVNCDKSVAFRDAIELLRLRVRECLRIASIRYPILLSIAHIRNRWWYNDIFSNSSRLIVRLLNYSAVALRGAPDFLTIQYRNWANSNNYRLFFGVLVYLVSVSMKSWESPVGWRVACCSTVVSCNISLWDHNHIYHPCLAQKPSWNQPTIKRNTRM